MTTYGNPATGQTSPRPSCWGLQYDNERECRNCSQNVSCRDQFIRNQATPRPATTTPSYYQTPPPAPSYYQTTHPISSPPVTPAPVTIKPQTAPAPVPVPIVAAPVQSQAKSPDAVTYYNDRYGAIQDPLFQVLGGTPPPLRAQYQGETFWERFSKNVVLACSEEFFHQCVLGVRQLSLPPKKPEDK